MENELSYDEERVQTHRKKRKMKGNMDIIGGINWEYIHLSIT